MRSIPTLVAASLATFLPAQDPAASLDIGDPGPPWTVDTWLHGPELSALQRDTFYYVEFWATWCAPCVASFPELSALQEAHASDRLVVVGISIDREKTADELKQFAKDQVARGRVRYALAWDSSDRMNDAWLRAAGISSIPAAAIVDAGGRIAFLGSAKQATRALPDILAGHFDVDAARRERAESRARGAERAQRAHELHDQFVTACHEHRIADAAAALDAIEHQGGYLVGYDQDRLVALLQAGEREAAFQLAAHRTRGSWKSDPAMLQIVVQCYAFYAKDPLDLREESLLWRAAAQASAAATDPLDQRTIVALVHDACGEPEQALALQRQVVEAAEQRSGEAAVNPDLLQFYRDRMTRFAEHAAQRDRAAK